MSTMSKCSRVTTLPPPISRTMKSSLSQGVKDEKVGKDQEEKPVIYFDEYKKGVILNQTNARGRCQGFGDGDPYSGLERSLCSSPKCHAQPADREAGHAIRMQLARRRAKKKAAAEVAAAFDDEIPD